MSKYILNKNFSVIECKDECLIHTINSIQEGDSKKDTTLYLNKSSYFILKALLDGKDIDEIADLAKNHFSSLNLNTEELKERVKNAADRLEKIGVIISHGS